MANAISFKSYCPDTQIHRHTQTGSIALLGPLKWAAKFGVNWRIAIISATVSWTSTVLSCDDVHRTAYGHLLTLKPWIQKSLAHIYTLFVHPMHHLCNDKFMIKFC